MKTFSIGLRTVQRAEDYCRRTLERLVESGTVQDPALLGTHLSHGSDCSANENAVRALRRAALDRPDWVLLLEDDIDVVDDFLGSVSRWLAAFARPEVRFYPLGCFDHDAVRRAVPEGALELALDSYYGSQAVALRREDAEAFIAWYPGRPPLIADSGWQYPSDRCLDLHLAAWHRELEPKQRFILTPAPCLIDHLGDVSSITDQDHGLTGRMLAFGGRDYRFELEEVAVG